MTELDKTIKMIHTSSIDELFKQLNDTCNSIEIVIKSDLEISYFYLGGQLEKIKSAMEKFETENNLKNNKIHEKN